MISKRFEQTVGLASEAAPLAILAGRGAARAIEMLEMDHGISIGSLQDLRSSLSALEQQHPSLAQSYQSLRHRLDKPNMKTGVGSAETALSPAV